MQFDLVYATLMPQLQNELKTDITYHTAEHTQSVIGAAIELAAGENVHGDDLTIIKTAALFHDAGFLTNATNHEEASCELARKLLPAFGYNPKQIDHVSRLIMSTRLPQSPEDHLSKILCDADLYYLGTTDYHHRANQLLKEMHALGSTITHNDWQIKQKEFLTDHRFFTKTAQQKLEKKKQATMQRLTSTQKAGNNVTKKFHKLLIAQDFFFTLIGTCIAAVALKLFLVPNHFFDGGITGISLLIHEKYHYNLGLVIVLLNLPLIIVSYFSAGRRFALGTLASVILLAIFLLVIPKEAVTADKLLISIFGGAFLGIGIGMVMRTGAALDGIEVLAVYTLKRTSFTIAEIILGINIIIFTIAGFMYGLETALYSVLTYFTATRCIDYVVEGLQAYTGVTIVSGKSEAIKYQLVNNLGRGITVYKGERGFLPGNFDISTDCDIIFTVITRLELRKLKNLVYEVDPKAFVFANTIKEATGGVIKRRHSH